jgi:MscS family membrane protein
MADRLGGPLALAWSLAAASVMLAWLGLAQPAQVLADRLLRAGLLIVLFWSMLRAVDVALASLSRAPWAGARQGSRSLLALTGRIAKVAVAALAVVAALSELGYPVASLLAGLGLGGLAFALAAQKTVENLFGALSIGLDQPFREGDFVRVEEMVGTVEVIGLRATRIRTLDRTLVSIPNGRLADMRLESFSARDRIRLACDLGLVYDTTGDQMRTVVEGLEAALRGHPKIWPDAVVVRFKQFGASSLDIEIMAWFQTSDWGEFQAIRQGVLLQFMDVVQAAGTSMAFPTRTVHLRGSPEGHAPSASAPAGHGPSPIAGAHLGGSHGPSARAEERPGDHEGGRGPAR